MKARAFGGFKIMRKRDKRINCRATTRRQFQVRALAHTAIRMIKPRQQIACVSVTKTFFQNTRATRRLRFFQ